MHLRNSILFLFLLFTMLPSIVSAQSPNSPTNQFQTDNRNNIEPSVLTVNVDGTNIAVYLYKPMETGRFPLLILSHGCPRLAEDRIKVDTRELQRQANAYAASGVAAVIAIRRGYGGQGNWAEGYGGCEHADYFRAGMAGAQDIDAVIAAMSKLPEIDASRIVLMGVSAGGWASIAAAGNPMVMGVVNFAGGRGNKGPGYVCQPENLVRAAFLYGRAAHAPELWIYSENDHFFSLSLASLMLDAFNSAGGQATLITAPPYGEDGHKYIQAISSWKPEVDDFLRKIGFLKFADGSISKR